jgi:hypothetical protein
MLKNKQHNLSTTGLPSLELVEEKKIGLQRGEIGAVDMPTLLASRPGQNDLALETSLPPCVVSSMTAKYTKDYDLMGYKMTAAVSQKDREMAIDLISSYCQPPSKADVLKGLTRLMLGTKDRTRSEAELRMTIELYCDEIMQYPADIALHVLNQATRESIWFPTLSELHKDMRWRADKRTMMLDALRRGDDSSSLQLVSDAVRRS